MERDFNTDEFEIFLKQKADQYKIYPSEKSWRNIYNTLHSKWKWFTLGGSLLLLTGLFFFSNDLTFNKPSNKSLKASSAISQKNTFLNSETVNHQVDVSTSLKPVFATSLEHTKSQEITSSSINLAPSTSSPLQDIDKNATDNSSNIQSVSRPHSQSTIGLHKPEGQLLPAHQEISMGTTLDVDAPVIGKPADDEANLVSKVEMHIAPLIESEAALSGEINWMEAMTSIKLNTQKNTPFHLQFYFSPSVSYRRLADNKSPSNISQQSIPLAVSNSKIDRYVDHKPSIGVELGSNILFSAGRNLTFKTGLQLNYSRYTIKAYKFYFEKASIALNTLGPVADTITSYTSFRNFSGYSPEELQNQYLQISVPIGAELKLLGNKRLQLSVAGTIQPTYLLLNDTYLLSTDYVNYAKEPSLVRKWNVHTSMEAFISYKVRGVRWQVGPQFRYQLMSSYNDRYPIKEYLFEYGVKVGVSKTLR